MVMEAKVDEDIAATHILTTWAKKFDALMVPDPQILAIKIRFLTNTSTPMTWGTMKTILDFHDIVVVEDQPTPNGPWVIRAHARRNLAQKEGPPWAFTDGDEIPDHEELITAVFQIKNGAGQQIFATVRGLLTRDTNRIGNILFVQGPEVLIIVDLASKVRYYRQVIEALDVAGPRKELKIFQISFAPVNELATIVTSVLQSLGGQGGPGQQPGVAIVSRGSVGGAGAGGTQVMADPRTNQLIVATFPINLPLIERVVSALDVRVAPASGRFHVYKCKNADATDLAAKIQELFTGQAPTTPGQPGGARPPPRRGPTQIGQTAEGVGAVETRVVADEQTNSLLIQAEERSYRDILEVLAQLDQKKRRVMIEAEVWEISTPVDDVTLGVELAGLTNAHQGSVRPAAGTSFGLSTIGLSASGNSLTRTPNLGAQGLAVVLTKDSFDKLPIIISAIHNSSEAKLITRPFAVTNDNTPSTFTVADSRPFLLTNNTTTGSVQQNVEFSDANTTLTIEPTVNSDDNLTLKITLEIASFTGSGSPTLPPPSNTRSYEGEVTVPNGQYVVFAGLESTQHSVEEIKVPFLGDLPIIGHLFKTWTERNSKSKIYIFVRPTIFSDPSFNAEKRLGKHMRARAHVESAKDEWLPPIVPNRIVKGAGFTVQDEAIELFGTGTANPFQGGGVAFFAE
jgi:general secretion pathway protein D